MKKEATDKLIQSAQEEFLGGFGIDFEQYKDPIVFIDRVGVATASIEWVHRISGKRLILSDIHFKETGEIVIAGSNAGDLVF